MCAGSPTPTPTLNRCQKTPPNQGQELPPEIQVNAGTRKAKLKTEFWRATETNCLTRQACQKSSQLSKPKPKPNKAKAKVKAKLQMSNGSPNQTKKLSATTKADEDKPKPETYTKESLTLS